MLVRDDVPEVFLIRSPIDMLNRLSRAGDHDRAIPKKSDDEVRVLTHRTSR
jgi:hypothetical protein